MTLVWACLGFQVMFKMLLVKSITYDVQIGHVRPNEGLGMSEKVTFFTAQWSHIRKNARWAKIF